MGPTGKPEESGNYEKVMIEMWNKDVNAHLSEAFRKMGALHDNLKKEHRKEMEKVQQQEANLKAKQDGFQKEQIKFQEDKAAFQKEKLKLQDDKAAFQNERRSHLEREERFEKYEASVEERESAVLSKEKELIDKKAKLKEQDDDLLALKDRLAEKEASFFRRDMEHSLRVKDLGDKEKELAEKQARLTEKEQILEGISIDVENARSRVKQEEAELEIKRKEIFEREETTANQLRLRVRDLEEQLREKDSQWKDTFAELCDLQKSQLQQNKVLKLTELERRINEKEKEMTSLKAKELQIQTKDLFEPQIQKSDWITVDECVENLQREGHGEETFTELNRLQKIKKMVDIIRTRTRDPRKAYIQFTVRPSEFGVEIAFGFPGSSDSVRLATGTSPLNKSEALANMTMNLLQKLKPSSTSGQNSTTSSVVGGRSKFSYFK